MTAIVPGRMTTAREEGLVVFVLGSRVHRPWAIHRWLPVALAFRRMMRALEGGAIPGFLGAQRAGGATLQYWESMEHLLAFAHDRAGLHVPAWAEFHRRVRASGAVGIWHETYVVPAGSVESMYVDMPPTGLGTIDALVPAKGHRETARGRLAATAVAPARAA